VKSEKGEVKSEKGEVKREAERRGKTINVIPHLMRDLHTLLMGSPLTTHGDPGFTTQSPFPSQHSKV
jgi:hypothetical protein